MVMPVLDNKQELTFNSSTWIQDIVWKNFEEQWMIGTDGERVSRKSMLAAEIGDNDNVMRNSIMINKS